MVGFLFLFTLYALLVCLIVDLLLTKTLSDSRFYVSSYYLGLFIHVGMGRLGDRWQVLILVAHADDDEDEQEALHIIFIFYVLDIPLFVDYSECYVVRLLVLTFR